MCAGGLRRYARRMQRYFSTFPGSLPGVGLLLLRIVVGGGATIQGVVSLRHPSEPDVLMWSGAVLAVVSGLAVLAGFVTPASGVVAGVTTFAIVATWVPPGTSGFIDRLAALILALDAAVLALLGPGALSMDARLFGRREIVIPHGPLR
jgi:uncharacterized membrane protein YphA (DoxX/SURF4 family)